MTTTLLLLTKLILLLVIWALIALFVLFILNSSKVYKKLRHLEDLYKTKKREALYNFVPLMINFSNYNKNLEKLLNINNIPKLDLIYPITFCLFKTLTIFESIKIGFSLTRKLLR